MRSKVCLLYFALLNWASGLCGSGKRVCLCVGVGGGEGRVELFFFHTLICTAGRTEQRRLTCYYVPSAVFVEPGFFFFNP